MPGLRRFISFCLIIFVLVCGFELAETGLALAQSAEGPQRPVLLSPLSVALPQEAASVELLVPSGAPSALSLTLYPLDISALLSKELALDYENLDEQSVSRLKPYLGNAQVLPITSDMTAPLRSTREGVVLRQTLPVLPAGTYLLKLSATSDSVSNSEAGKQKATPEGSGGGSPEMAGSSTEKYSDRIYQLVNISEVGIIHVNSGVRPGLLWVADLRSGQAVKPQEVYQITWTAGNEANKNEETAVDGNEQANSGSARTGNVGGNSSEAVLTKLLSQEDGFINLPGRSIQTSALYIVKAKNQIALYLAAPPAAISDRWKAFLWCNSRSLAAGSQLQYRAVVSELNRNGLANDSLKELFTVELCTLRGKVLASNKSALGFNGTMNGVLSVPETVRSEPHVLVLKDSKNLAVAACGLAGTPPESSHINLTVKSAQPYLTVGRPAVLDVELTDKEGLPMPGVEVGLDFALCQADLEQGYKLGNLGAKAQDSFAASAKLPHLTVTTNYSGKAQAKFTCPALISKNAEFAVVRVQAAVQKRPTIKARSSCSFTVVKAPLLLEVQGHNTLHLNGQAQYLIGAYKLNGQPQENLKVEVSALDKSGRILNLGNVVTDPHGQALFAWKPNEAGEYTLKFAVVDGDPSEFSGVSGARSASPSKNADRSAPDTKSPSGAEFANYLSGLQVHRTLEVLSPMEKTGNLMIEAEKRYCEAGEVNRLQFYSPSPNENIMVVLEDGGTLRRYLLTTDKNGRAAWNLTMSERFAPSLKIMAWAVNNINPTNFDFAEVFIDITQTKQILQVEADFETVPVSGQANKLNVKVTDSEGKTQLGFANLELVGPYATPYLERDNLLAAFCLPYSLHSELGKYGSNFSRKLSLEQTPSLFELPVTLFPENSCLDLGTLELGAEVGRASANVKLPKQEGEWNLIVNVGNMNGMMGQAVIPFTLKKDISVEFRGPALINRGDFVKFSVVLKNRTRRNLPLKASAVSEDRNILLLHSSSDRQAASDAKIDFAPYELAAGSAKKFDFMLKGGLPGAGCVIFELATENGRERHAFPVEVRPLATIYRQDTSGELNRDLNLSLNSFKPEFIGRVFDRRLHVEVMNGVSGLLCASVEDLKSGGWTAESSESILTSWIAPQLCALPWNNRELEAPKLFGVSSQEASVYLSSLQSAQNKDGGFGWRVGLKSDFMTTVMVVRYLQTLKPDGSDEVEALLSRAKAYLYNIRKDLDSGTRLLIYLTDPAHVDAKELQEAVAKFDKLDNPALMSLVHALYNHGSKQQAQKIWNNFRKKRADKFCAGNCLLSDCQTTALGLLVSLELGDNESSANYLNWLALSRRGRSWGVCGDSLLALEAISSYMDKNFASAKPASYGIWINGNEVESGHGLGESEGWHRAIDLNAAQLPDSTLNVKLIKSGDGVAWVHLYEELTVHGLSQSVGSNNGLSITNTVPALASGAPLYGKSVEINVNVNSKQDLHYVTITLPYLAALNIDRVDWPQNLDSLFVKGDGQIYLTSLPKGVHKFVIKGKLLSKGEFTMAPARLEQEKKLWPAVQAEPVSISIAEID